jgi:hypothetical protein
LGYSEGKQARGDTQRIRKTFNGVDAGDVLAALQ